LPKTNYNILKLLKWEKEQKLKKEMKYGNEWNFKKRFKNFRKDKEIKEGKGSWRKYEVWANLERLGIKENLRKGMWK